MRPLRKVLIFSCGVVVSVLITLTAVNGEDQRDRWSEQAANEWYAKQPWLVGSNFIPATAINQLEMWQEDTFDPKCIDRELGLAESLGFNTIRVFLHHLLWEQDSAGFSKRIGIFLNIAEKHHIRPILVLFDSCWDPNPHLGKQPSPRPGVMLFAWAQSPGAAALADTSQYPKLKDYVKGVVGAFANDKRVLAWDVWNEPDNTNGDSYGKEEPPNKAKLVEALLPTVFAWAREAGPRQPLTSSVWAGGWSGWDSFTPVSKIQVAESDVISFHTYDTPAEVEQRITSLRPYHRPILCTEYMARSRNSTFQNTMPILKQHHVAAINWGFVNGKTQTMYPWDSWAKPYDQEPVPWFHDIFRNNGEPYDAKEVEFIRKMTHAGVKEDASDR